MARHSLDAGLFIKDQTTHTAWSDGTVATTDEIDIVGDASYTSENEFAEIRDRSSNFVEGLMGKRNFEVTFDMTYSRDNTQFKLLARKHKLREVASILMLDDDDPTATGARGVWAAWAVVNMDKEESLSEGQTANVTLRPLYQSDSNLKPEFVVIGGGS